MQKNWIEYKHSPRTNLLASLAHFSISGPGSVTPIPTSGHHSGTFACGSILLNNLAGSGTRLLGAAATGDETATTTSFPPRLRSLLRTTAPPPPAPPHHPLPQPRCPHARSARPSSTRTETTNASDQSTAPAAKCSDERRKVRTTRSPPTTRTAVRRSR
jgi:hypothetical protein